MNEKLDTPKEQGDRATGVAGSSTETHSWRNHAIDLRLSIPVFKRRYYATFVAVHHAITTRENGAQNIGWDSPFKA